MLLIDLAKMAKIHKFGLANSLLDSPMATWLTLMGTLIVWHSIPDSLIASSWWGTMATIQYGERLFSSDVWPWGGTFHFLLICAMSSSSHLSCRLPTLHFPVGVQFNHRQSDRFSICSGKVTCPASRLWLTLYWNVTDLASFLRLSIDLNPHSF